MVLGNAQTATTEIKGNVGLGTNAPAAKLDVNGSAIVRTNLTVMGTLDTTNLVVNGSITQTVAAATNYFAGRVGIGTNQPAQTLEVHGRVQISDPSGYPKFIFNDIPSAKQVSFQASGGNFIINDNSSGINGFKVDTIGSVENTFVLKQGRIGILTNTPAATLDVNGAVCIDYTTNAAPAAVTNKIFLFVTNSISAAELQVKDGLGNITTLSPHDGTKHLATSYNEWTGEGRKIDLDELAKGVQRLLTIAAKADPSTTNGIDVSRIYQTTEQAPRDWDANQAEVEAKQDAVIAAWQSDTNAVDVKGPKPAKYHKAPKPAWLVDWQQEHRK
jgi:hypothetical protein